MFCPTDHLTQYEVLCRPNIGTVEWSGAPDLHGYLCNQGHSHCPSVLCTFVCLYVCVCVCVTMCVSECDYMCVFAVLQQS